MILSSNQPVTPVEGDTAQFETLLLYSTPWTKYSPVRSFETRSRAENLLRASSGIRWRARNHLLRGRVSWLPKYSAGDPGVRARRRSGCAPSGCGASQTPRPQYYQSVATGSHHRFISGNSCRLLQSYILQERGFEFLSLVKAGESPWLSRHARPERASSPSGPEALDLARQDARGESPHRPAGGRRRVYIALALVVIADLGRPHRGRPGMAPRTRASCFWSPWTRRSLAR